MSMGAVKDSSPRPPRPSAERAIAPGSRPMGSSTVCLYGRMGLDLRAPLRGGATPEEVAAMVARSWAARADRGTEDRQKSGHRGPRLSLERPGLSRC